MNSNSLKIIALITMLVDHSALLLTHRYPNLAFYMRCIGRISFPIFAFVISESIYYTSNKKKLCIRLFLFAFISEIPFDVYFLYNPDVTIISQLNVLFNSQNVFFTFAFAVFGCIIVENWNKHIFLENMFVLILFIPASYFIHGDYGVFSIYFIILLYICKFYFQNFYKKAKLVILFTMVILFYRDANTTFLLFALLSIPILYLYNNEKGVSRKYFFYIIYPLHISILAVIKIAFTSF